MRVILFLSSARASRSATWYPRVAVPRVSLRGSTPRGHVVLELCSPDARPLAAGRLLFLTGAPGSVLTPRVRRAPPPPTPPSTTSAPRLNPRHASYCRTRTGRRATWAAQGDYLLDLSTTRTSCQRHRRARVAPDTAPGRIIGHRPS